MKRITDTTTDRDSGWTEVEKATAEGVGHGRAWRPIVAGVLEMVASAPYFLASLTFFLFPTRMQDADTFMTGATTPGVVEVWAPVGLVMWLPFALPLVVGGVCALFRRGWDLAFLGPLAPLALTVFLLPWGNLGLNAFGSLFTFGWVPAMPVRWAIVAAFFAMMIAALALVALSRKAFPRRRNPTAYHGAGPS